MNDAIDNKTKCLMYALNLTNSHNKSHIQHILNQLNQFKIDSTINSNSNANANSNVNANFNQKINTDIEMKNAQSKQNNQQKTQTIMKSRIEKFIIAKMKKIESQLNSKLHQMINFIQSGIEIIKS